MRKISLLLILALVGACSHFSHTNHKHNESIAKSLKEKADIGQKSYQAVIINGKAVTKGKKSFITLKLTKNGNPITLADLEEIHTQKIHLLLNNKSFTDYHHIHPKAGKNPGEYVFAFTPKEDGEYKIWVDITPIGANQRYITAEIPSLKNSNKILEKIANQKIIVDGYQFELGFDRMLKEGEAASGEIIITKNGKEINNLEPVMSAYAHIVGFYDDYQSIVHIHPMGIEPKNMQERGKGRLSFHIEPSKSGFIKLYAQIRVNNKDIFAPFGVMIAQ